MSATNQTPNYGLPQYIGTDVPSYLGDFNKAMLDIDTAIKGVDNKATSAESSVATANSNATQALENSETAQTTAETAQTTAETAQATATSAKSTANSANTTAGTAKSTADTALKTAQSALQTANTANATANKTNTDIGNWVVPSSIGANRANVRISRNKKLGLLGIACRVLNGQGSTSGSTTTIGTLPSGMRPSSARTIYGGAMIIYADSVISRDLTINTNGTITVPVGNDFQNIVVQSMLCTEGWGLSE